MGCYFLNVCISKCESRDRAHSDLQGMLSGRFERVYNAHTKGQAHGCEASVPP